MARTDYLLRREAEIVMAALMPANRLAVKVCLHTGLRIGDVLALKTAQLAPRMTITEAKTGKRRRIGLPAALLDELRAQAGSVYVFPHRTDESKHRSRSAVWKDVKRAAKAFRLPQNVAPHSFRKLYAVELYKKYGDIERVRRVLNHDEVATTIIYALADRLVTQKKG